MNTNQTSHVKFDYIHFSTIEHGGIDLSRKYMQTTENLVFHTPNGLWLSVSGPNDWEQYCLKESYRLENLKAKFQITLKPEARILLLDSGPSFEAFEKEYGYYAEGIERQGDNYTLQMSIAWDRIITDYQGLTVCDVLPKLYNMGLWYDTWCCTSACIWDLQAVEKAEKLA